MPENTTVGQRFSQLIAHLGISKNAFAASLDKTATVIQHLVDERNKPGFDLLCKVFEVYPNLSKDWLLQGNGPMIAEESMENSSNSAPAQNASTKPASTKEKPPVAAASAPAAVSVAQPAAEVSSPKTPTAPEPVVARQAAAEPVAAATQPSAPEAPPAVAPVVTPAAQVADTSWQTALYTQQMAHQLAMAELRNQHLQEQQRLMQQMMDLMQQKL